jgi:hypothetical protein
MSNKPFSFTDKDAVAKFFGDLNEIVYGVNTYTPVKREDDKEESPRHIEGECTSSCRRVGCPETND